MRNVWDTDSTVVHEYYFQLKLANGDTLMLPPIEAVGKQNAMEVLMAYHNLEDLDVVGIKIK